MTATDYIPQEEDDESEAEEAPAWKYPTLNHWMENWFLLVAFRFDRDPVKWCDNWWRHRYAVERLGALWMAWETMYPDPDARSSWWVYHFDPHWSALTKGESSPFRDCGTKHEETEKSPSHVAPPTDWPLPRAMA